MLFENVTHLHCSEDATVREAVHLISEPLRKMERKDRDMILLMPTHFLFKTYQIFPSYCRRSRVDMSGIREYLPQKI